jgi:hypothetical protein
LPSVKRKSNAALWELVFVFNATRDISSRDKLHVSIRGQLATNVTVTVTLGCDDLKSILFD